MKYFLTHAQYSVPVQALAALVNIQLPYQKAQMAGALAGAGAVPASPTSSRAGQIPMGAAPQPTFASLVPYVRRLVATGFDVPPVLHGFFGDDWLGGIGPLHEAERRNFLFAAKSDNWSTVKASYDMGDLETVPFLRPLVNVNEKEIENAEINWSEWLAMQDWMLGPRAPPEVLARRANMKSEDDNN